MKHHIFGIVLLAAFSAVWAQTQSGSSIGANSPGVGGNVQPRPVPLPSTAAGADSTGAPARSQPAPETSVGTSGATAPPLPERSSGLCDTLTGQERTQCLREQARTGTAGAGSAGGSAGGSLK
jgi:hypothetical protein